jgi:hypothetical protein
MLRNVDTRPPLVKIVDGIPVIFTPRAKDKKIDAEETTALLKRIRREREDRIIAKAVE